MNRNISFLIPDIVLLLSQIFYQHGNDGMSGQLLASMKPVKNARGYQTQTAEMTGDLTGPWGDAAYHSGSRNMSVTGLTPGHVYAFRVRALGGSTGESDWSASSAHMSMYMGVIPLTQRPEASMTLPCRFFVMG